LARTLARRPEMLDEAVLDATDRALLREIESANRSSAAPKRNSSD
jgi:hypothetical protein